MYVHTYVYVCIMHMYMYVCVCIMYSMYAVADPIIYRQAMPIF